MRRILMLVLLLVVVWSRSADAQIAYSQSLGSCAKGASTFVQCASNVTLNVGDTVIVSLATFTGGQGHFIESLGTAGITWSLDADKIDTRKSRTEKIRGMLWRGDVMVAGTVTGLRISWGGQSAPAAVTAAAFTGVGERLFGNLGGIAPGGGYASYMQSLLWTGPYSYIEVKGPTGSLFIGTCAANFGSADGTMEASQKYLYNNIIEPVQQTGGSRRNAVSGTLGWLLSPNADEFYAGECVVVDSAGNLFTAIPTAGAGAVYAPR